jgi:hypothetical protein
MELSKFTLLTHIFNADVTVPFHVAMHVTSQALHVHVPLINRWLSVLFTVGHEGYHVCYTIDHDNYNQILLW